MKLILLLLVMGTVHGKEIISQENANWKIFTNRSQVHAIALSKEAKTLWVGTEGGLEQWNFNTQQMLRVFRNVDGLPNNYIKSLVVDNQDNLWVGTFDGLACREASSQTWNVFKTLPHNYINTLLIDDKDNLWVGTKGGLVRRSTNCKEWKPVFHNELADVEIQALLIDDRGQLWAGTERKGLARRNTDGSWVFINLPSNNITALASDGNGGLWIGTGWDKKLNSAAGLVNFTANGKWLTYNTKNSKLPVNAILSLLKDDKGGLWVGTEEGLIYRDNNNQWIIGYDQNTGLPANGINALLADGNEGLWVGTGHYTGHGGLAYFASKKWNVLTSETVGIPSNSFFALLPDEKGGLWVGSGAISGDLGGQGGLGYYNKGKWTVYTPENLKINEITSLLFDGAEALWIGTEPDGLAHFNITSKKWKIFNTSNSKLPDNTVLSLASDSQGLWIGTRSGLTYHSVNNEWKNFDSSNSRLEKAPINKLLLEADGSLWIGISDPYDESKKTGLIHRSVTGKWTDYSNKLPNDSIRAFALFDKGLWIGTENGLVHRSATNQWEVWNTEDSKLPGKMITALIPDNNGGLWIGIGWYGLAYRSSSDEWTLFDSSNSGLSTNFINALALDHGNLWIGGGGGGLSSLSFGQKSTLCTQVNASNCQTLVTNKRAAIIIAGGGSDTSNTLWETTAGISDYIYKMLSKRGFDNDEIYYLSSQSYADFNGDGMDDCIVDAPATNRCQIKSVAKPILERSLIVEDVGQALDWAKTRGKLNQPLYVFFNNHGGTDKFQLAKGRYLEVLKFKALLDDYQQETGNQLVLVIDACYSGILLKKLIAPNRAIISSTGNGLAYFDRANKLGFSRFFSKGLLKGMNFYEAFGYATDKQTKLVNSLSIGQDQIPQLYDGQKGQWLTQLYVNGSFVTGDSTLAVEGLTQPTSLTAGKTLMLQVQVSLAQGTVKRVWAVLKPPKVNLVMDHNGTPILAFPSLSLSRSSTTNVWQATWRDAVYNGNHEITFYAEDNEGNIASSESVNINVTGGADAPQKSTVQLILNTNSINPGNVFKVQLIENLGWGYDLYTAIVLPNGEFVTLKNTNKLTNFNQISKWRGQRIQNSPVTLLSLNLPNSLAKGQYCLYGILSPEKESAIEAMSLWVMEKQCFDVFLKID